MQAPEVSPIATETNKSNLDASKSINNKIVKKIKTQNNIIEIDNLGRIAQVTFT